MESTHLKRLRATLERIDAQVDLKTGQRGAGAASRPFLRELKHAVARVEAEAANGVAAGEVQEVRTLPDASGRPELKPATR
jgi:hypothetical protein